MIRLYGSGWIASGILLYQGGTVDIVGANTITNSQASLVYQETDGTIDGIVINSPAVDYARASVFVITDTKRAINPTLRYLPVSLLDGEGIGYGKGAPTTVSISDADITGVNQPGSYGIACWALGDDVIAEIENSIIGNWEIGVVDTKTGPWCRQPDITTHSR